MKRTFIVIIFAALASTAQAGVLKVTTQPVRHPLKDTKKVLAIASYPVRHPVKTVF